MWLNRELLSGQKLVGVDCKLDEFSRWATDWISLAYSSCFVYLQTENSTLLLFHSLGWLSTCHNWNNHQGSKLNVDLCNAWCLVMLVKTKTGQRERLSYLRMNKTWKGWLKSPPPSPSLLPSPIFATINGSLVFVVFQQKDAQHFLGIFWSLFPLPWPILSKNMALIVKSWCFFSEVEKPKLLVITADSSSLYGIEPLPY